MERQIKEVRQAKKNNKWETVYTITDEKEVYKALSEALIAKKLTKVSYIRSIKRTQNYDGTLTITVSYTGGVRAIFTVKDR